MTDDSRQTFAALLARARSDASAVRDLFPLVYDQLRRIAHAQRRRSTAATLNTTAVVHEAYMRLAGRDHIDVRDRSHFMAIAAAAMRQVLIDYTRARTAAKRGGGVRAVSFDEIGAALEHGPRFTDEQAEALLAVDDAITRLAQLSERQGRVVECRFYAGLSIEETAQAIGVSPATVKRDWAMAQSWLYRDLRDTLE